MINCITQEQAKTKLCCGPFGMSTNGTCRGASCMAWRFRTAIFNVDTKQWAQPGDKLLNFETRVTDLGYCGLAGAPMP